MSAKLFTVLVNHVAPKDQHASIETYVIADDEVTVRDRIDLELNHETWKDRSEGDEEDDDEEEEVLDLEADGDESYLARMLRLRGDYNDEEDESLFEDAYYGRTHYGWDEGKPVTEAEIAVLVALGVARDWRVPAS